jgi:hypothetical protein
MEENVDDYNVENNNAFVLYYSPRYGSPLSGGFSPLVISPIS